MLFLKFTFCISDEYFVTTSRRKKFQRLRTVCLFTLYLLQVSARYNGRNHLSKREVSEGLYKVSLFSQINSPIAKSLPIVHHLGNGLCDSAEILHVMKSRGYNIFHFQNSWHFTTLISE